MAPHSVDLVVQSLPPIYDAIGEYTSCLASELAKSARARIVTATDVPSEPIDGVETISRFQLTGPKRFAALREHLATTDADAVVLQYNPFGWGRRGWAPDLVHEFRRFKKMRPDVRFGVMFHETFMMNPGFRSWVMRLYQRRQFIGLSSIADVCFFSTELWTHEARERDPDVNAVHLPVGANLPRSTVDPMTTRKHWGIQADDFVCGVFGGAHPSRMLPWVESAVEQIAKQRRSSGRVVFLHVGGEWIDWSMPNEVLVVRTGRLPAIDASDATAIMDLMINPFSDGISTRRGSVMAALLNGVPVLSTQGHATDRLWHNQISKSLFLSAANCTESWNRETHDAAAILAELKDGRKDQIKLFYDDHFSWSVIAESVCHHLSRVHTA